jgi:hypothetical protein
VGKAKLARRLVFALVAVGTAPPASVDAQAPCAPSLTLQPLLADGELLMTSMRMRAASALLAVALLASAADAIAAPIGRPLAVRPATGLVEQVHWRGRGWGWGSGAFIGPGPYYYYYDSGYRPWDYADPAPSYQPPPEGDLQSCMQRHKSYNPRTGFYRGKDGGRHRCP